MAWSLQKLFAVEEEFEDEDFLSAVKDVETTFSGPGPSVNKCLRPITSSLQTPDRTQSVPHQQLDDRVNSVSPVLGLQSPSRSSVGINLPSRSIHSLRPVSVHSRRKSSPVLNFTDTKESRTLGCTVSAASSKNCISHASDQQPPYSSNTKFKFTSKPVPSGDSGKVVDLDSEDALFLSACTELDAPSVEMVPEPGMVEHRHAHELQESVSQVHVRKAAACDSAVTKKLCVTGQKESSSLGTSGIVQRQEGQLAQMSTHNTCESPSMSSGLNLRSSTAGEWQHLLPFTSRPTAPVTSALTPTNTTRFRTIGVAYQATKPIHTSLYQSGTGLSSSSNNHQGLMPFSSIRSPPPCLSAGGTCRLPAPQMPTLNYISPRMSSSTFQQPSTLKPCTETSTVSLRTPYSSVAGPSTLQSPVLTNHLVQLVTAANKTPQTDSWNMLQAKTRRFPGPAGILPQQHGGRNLEEILISTPHKPAHGALAKFRSEEASSSPQPADESFGRGPWSMMKAELRLDENDPCCFLKTCSVVMVLRKAVLKQLPKNKVPQMAVMLKSLTRATVDASAVFRDPTGEIQGTVHHMLLEERESDLKVGAVLLLQQVGVFSPSLRNHYLNITPNNLVKVYLPDSDSSSSQVLQQKENGTRQDSLASGRTVSPEAQRKHTQTHLHPDQVMMSSSRSTSMGHKYVGEPSEQVAGEWDTGYHPFYLVLLIPYAVVLQMTWMGSWENYLRIASHAWKVPDDITSQDCVHIRKTAVSFQASSLAGLQGHAVSDFAQQ